MIFSSWVASLNKQKFKDFVASSCKQWIAVPKRFDFIKKVIDTQEDYHWFSENSLAVIEKTKEEQKVEIKSRSDLLQSRQNEYSKVAKCIVSSFIAHATEIEQSQDAWIQSIIEKWFRFFQDDDQTLLDIINFISNRFMEYNSLTRLKAVQEWK